MEKIKVIPNSTFFICFLDDIERPESLSKIMTYEEFNFVLGRIVRNEISKSRNYQKISYHIENATLMEYEAFEEVLKPFMSSDEISRGEHEAIAIAYVMDYLGERVILVLDDEDARKFVSKNLKGLSGSMVGTIGFIKKCCCNYAIFDKNEAISILLGIKKSKFRINERIIEDVIKEIEGC